MPVLHATVVAKKQKQKYANTLFKALKIVIKHLKIERSKHLKIEHLKIERSLLQSRFLMLLKHRVGGGMDWGFGLGRCTLGSME